jgi:thiamine monophosphate synthase
MRRLLPVVADDPNLAMRCGIGLHVPERSVGTISPRVRLWRASAKLLLTCAAHAPESLRRAAHVHPDAILLAPIFSTASHRGGKAVGVLSFARWIKDVRTPVLALGGINATTALRLGHTGASGIAAIGGFL